VLSHAEQSADNFAFCGVFMANSEPVTSLRRLLIVSANFPPTNAVDMHRLRLSLPYYRQFGWEPTVVAFRPECADHPQEPSLVRTVPTNIDVRRVSCIDEKWTRPFGLGAVGFRGLLEMRRFCLHVAKETRPELAFFSTTSFPLMSIGPWLRRRCGVPYVLDFQDPWISPGGTIHDRSLKHRLVHRLHRQLEPSAINNASGLMAVAPDYLDVLSQRYPTTADTPRAVVPFGTPDSDIAYVRENMAEVMQECPAELAFDLSKYRVGVYAGAYVSSMRPMVSQLFASLRSALASNPQLKDRLRLWFVGSHYSSRVEGSPISELALQYDVSEVVREHGMRLPYLTALAIAIQSDFTMLFGSMSASYNPSKLFTLLSTGRPLLAVTLPGTLAADLLSNSGGCCMVHLDNDSSSELSRFFADSTSNVSPLNKRFVEGFSAQAVTEMQASLFDKACNVGEHH
jgi:hypothetical protein